MMRRMPPARMRMARLALLMLAVLLVAACGQEAPLRAVRATPSPSPYATRTPAPVTLPTVAVAMDTPVALPAEGQSTAALERALGDPHAPITVVEYSDYQ
jgi:type IV pilus biogenesis protein CpaD/CtpE